MSSEKEKEYRREYRRKNKERLAKKRKEWKEKNKEMIKQKAKEYREANADKLTAYARSYVLSPEQKVRDTQRRKERSSQYRENRRSKLTQEQREEINRKKREDRKNNPEKYREQYRNNKEKVIKASTRRRKERLIADPIFALREKIRGNIKESIKHKGVKKNTRTEAILGCTYETFISYITEDFKRRHERGPEFSLEKLELHHKVFMCTAQTEEEVLSLNRYTNLMLVTEEEHKQIHKGGYRVN